MTHGTADNLEFVVGVDGCRGGWIAAELHLPDHRIRFRIFATFPDLVTHYPEPVVLGIDVPIGLETLGPRACDGAARKRLGFPKSSSVFSAPVRGILGYPTWADANERSKALHGKGISRQTFGIMPKIAEVDAVMREDLSLQERIVEVHPEVSFREIAGGRALLSKKKRVPGFAERRDLLLAALPGLVIPATRPEVRAFAGAPADDVLDAIAAAWTALRFARVEARTLLDDPSTDAAGLIQRIVF